MNMRAPLKNETVQPFFAIRVLGESLATTFMISFIDIKLRVGGEDRNVPNRL
jgi:hypothetical protein